MESWVLVAGFVAGLFMIWRFATKKNRPGPRRVGVVVARARPGQAPRPQGATMGTVALVNIVCAIGSIAYIAIYASGTRDGWWLFGGLAALFAFPFIGMKVLEANEPGSRYSIVGSMAALCILAWLLGAPWFVMEIAADIRGS